MVKHPGDYLWSSYHSNAGEKHNMLLTLHPVYKRLGGFIDQQRHAYRELFGSCLDRSELHVIREALNQELVLGREDFKDKIELMTKWQSRPGIPGRPRVEEGSTIYYAI